MKTNQFEEKNYENIKTNLENINKKIEIAAAKAKKNPENIKLMAVTKNVKVKYVNFAIENGINFIGENRVQELNQKYFEYKKEKLRIDFIGHLQTRKVKDVIKIVDCIESVDSLKLANVISKEAEKAKKIMPILVEVNIGNEKSKFGFHPKDIFIAINQISKISNIKIEGLMSIPPIENAEYYFKQMQSIYIDISNKKIDNVNMKYLSMGMSGDFEKAISFGANIVRIGSLLFGDRV